MQWLAWRIYCLFSSHHRCMENCTYCKFVMYCRLLKINCVVPYRVYKTVFLEKAVIILFYQRSCPISYYVYWLQWLLSFATHILLSRSICKVELQGKYSYASKSEFIVLYLAIYNTLSYIQTFRPQKTMDFGNK